MAKTAPKPKAKAAAKPRAKTVKKKPSPAPKKPSKVKKPPRVKTGANGRPSDYHPEYANEVTKLYLLGATNEQVCEIYEISKPTFYSWQKKYPNFKAAIRAGKLMADAEVANGLYQRAVGAVTEDWRETLDKDGQITNLKSTKQHPPETHAAKWWLKNRQPEIWKESIEVEDSLGAFSIVINECLRPKTPTDER